MKFTNTLLVLVLLLCGAIGYYSYKTSEEVKALREQLQVAELKVDSLMTATAKIAQSTKSTRSAAPKKQQKSIWEELFSALDNNDGQKTATKTAGTPKMTVSSSYRLEDRYVSSKVRLPEYVGDQEGKIVVNITVDHMGDVTKTSVGEGSTITDEEVIEACRKAALRTNFNYASGAINDLEGTITYTFIKQ